MPAARYLRGSVTLGAGDTLWLIPTVSLNRLTKRGGVWLARLESQFRDATRRFRGLLVPRQHCFQFGGRAGFRRRLPAGGDLSLVVYGDMVQPYLPNYTKLRACS